MKKHYCWHCHAEHIDAKQLNFCFDCGAPYQERHITPTHNMPIVDDAIDFLPGEDITSILTIPCYHGLNDVTPIPLSEHVR